MPFREQELRLAQEVAGLAIWEWHLETDELRWLPGSVALFGRPLAEIRMRKKVGEFIHAEDRENVKRAVRKAIDQSGEFDVEYRVQWPNGELHWIRSRARVFQNPERGNLVIGVAQDITQAKALETNLQAQARLLELAHEPILARDAEDKIIYWNKGAERLYGYTSSEAKRRVSHDLLATKFPEPLREIQARLSQRGYWEGELIHTTKDNRLIHVASRWQSFSSDGISILETNFDLSQQRALQIAKLWEQKARLLGELSHEINNPLAAATSAAYMLKNAGDKAGHQYIEVLETAIGRIAEFIRKSNELHQSMRRDEEHSQQDTQDRLQ